MITIRNQADFVESISSLLEQELEPCREWGYSLERTWFRAVGEGWLVSRTSRVRGGFTGPETQPTAHKFSTALMELWSPGHVQQQHDVSQKLLKSWLVLCVCVFLTGAQQDSTP